MSAAWARPAIAKMIAPTYDGLFMKKRPRPVRSKLIPRVWTFFHDTFATFPNCSIVGCSGVLPKFQSHGPFLGRRVLSSTHRIGINEAVGPDAEVAWRAHLERSPSMKGPKREN